MRKSKASPRTTRTSEDVRFVVLADLHAHPWSAFARGDGLSNSRLQRSLEVLEASLKYASAEGIPWLFAGDLVHTAGYALNVVLTGVTAVLRDFSGVAKLAVWGNHDVRGVGGRITFDQTVYPSILAAVPSFALLDPSHTASIELSDGLTIAGAGYQPHPHLLTYAPEADVGMYHQTVRGSVAPNGFVLDEGIEAAELISRYRLSLVGHVHHPQQIDAPVGQGILIPGSPEHHNFGDRGEHGWWVVTLPGDRRLNPQLEFVVGGSPEFRTVDTPREVKADGHFYRARTVPVGMELPEGAMMVAPMPTTVQHRDVLRGVAEVEQVLQTWLKVQPPEAGAASADDHLAVGRQLLSSQDPARLRDVRLMRLHLKNFCCFADEEIEITPGLWLITGHGRDYPSNGAGKSTLIGEALYWLLFGRTTKGLGADEVVRRGTVACEVTATLDDVDAQGEIIIRRRRGPTGHTLEVSDVVSAWEAVSVNEMTEKLSKYLGLTPEIFQNLAYFSQEKLLLFSSATDGERKTVLADLIGLRAYQEASSAAGAQVQLLETTSGKLGAQLEFAESELMAARAELLSVQHEVEAWEERRRGLVLAAEAALWKVEADDAAQQAAERLVVLQRLVAELIERRSVSVRAREGGRAAAYLQELTREHEEALGRLRQRLQGAEAVVLTKFATLDYARECAAKLPDARMVLEQQEATLRQLQGALGVAVSVLASVRAEWNAVGKEFSRAERALREAAAQFALGICPTCGQVVEVVHQERCLTPLHDAVRAAEQERQASWHRVQSAEFAEAGSREQMVAAESRVGQVLIRIKQFQEAETLLRERAACERELAAAQPRGLEVAALERARLASDREIGVCAEHQRTRLLRVSGYVERLAREHEVQSQDARRQLVGIQAEINPHSPARVEERVRGLEAKISEAQVLQAQARVQTAIYEYWRTGFSKQGLQSLLVEEVATRFNAQRGNIFPLLTQGVYDVQFSTLSATRAGELRERTEFFVYERGQAVSYETLSGGQRRRIDIGIMLVLTLAVAEWMGVRGLLGLLILDEVFGFLDASGAEGLLAALGQVSEQVPTIYVITHDTHLQSMVPNMICVEQDSEGVSTVV